MVQSVGRSLELLEAVAATQDAGLLELAERTGLSPSTTHRLLSTLVAYGYVVQDPQSSRYRLGHRLMALAGGAADRTARLRETARPRLGRMRDAYDETVNLTVLDRFSIVYVDQVESSRPVRMFSRIGNRVPAHASGAGKAMLAYQPPAALAALFASAPYEALTPRTITDREALAAELERIRERGYAMDDEEYDEGVACVAAPIFGAGGVVEGALSVSGPVGRMQRLDLAEVGAAARSLTAEVSAELGFAP